MFTRKTINNVITIKMELTPFLLMFAMNANITAAIAAQSVELKNRFFKGLMKNLADIIPQNLLQMNPAITTEFTKFCLATGTEVHLFVDQKKNLVRIFLKADIDYIREYFKGYNTKPSEGLEVVKNIETPEIDFKAIMDVIAQEVEADKEQFLLHATLILKSLKRYEIINDEEEIINLLEETISEKEFIRVI
jgi:hypothetical protein